ncbi:MAG: apolipoprotein N-acyltransferase [Thermoanaerobaculia bacterium]
MILHRRSHRFAAALFGGALLAFAFPGAGIDLLALVALAPIVAAVLRARSWGEAFLLGAAGYFVTWLINVPWVIPVMVRYGGLPMPVGISLYVLLALVVAMYGGLFAFLVWRYRRLPPPAIWILVPAAWAAVEFLRTFLLTGFPWNLLAVALIDTPPLVILARVIGPYGVAFLAMIPATLLGWIAATPGVPKRKATAGVAAVALVAAWLGAGALILSRIDPSAGEPLDAAMLQPNITLEMRWDLRSAIRIYELMMEMSREAAAERPGVVIWPESTVPLTFAVSPFYRESVEDFSLESGADVILGSIAEDAADPTQLWNAAYLVTEGEVKGRYDKVRLVPFGEYVPLRELLFFADELVRAVGDFQFGSSERPLVGRFAYGPAICYEIVFPQIATTQVRNGATVLVTITNDAWFGETAAPRQHLDAARLRAIETDRWLLRAATTGISAAVDPAGRIVASLPVGERGIVRAHASARQSTTPYVRFGDWFGWAAAIAAALAAVIGRIPERLRRNHG